MLKTLLINNKYSNLKMKLLMWKSLVKPIWIYSFRLWGNAGISNPGLSQYHVKKINNHPHWLKNSNCKRTSNSIAYKNPHLSSPALQSSYKSSLSECFSPGNPPRGSKNANCEGDLLNLDFGNKRSKKIITRKRHLWVTFFVSHNFLAIHSYRVCLGHIVCISENSWPGVCKQTVFKQFFFAFFAFYFLLNY